MPRRSGALLRRVTHSLRNSTKSEGRVRIALTYPCVVPVCARDGRAVRVFPA